MKVAGVAVFAVAFAECAIVGEAAKNGYKKNWFLVVTTFSIIVFAAIGVNQKRRIKLWTRAEYESLDLQEKYR